MFYWCLQQNWFAALTRRALCASYVLKEGQYETVRTSDVSQSLIESCKLVCSMNVLHVQCKMIYCAIWMFRVCNVACYGVQYECFACAKQYVIVWKWVFVCTRWYAFVWKWVFVCTMKYAMVCIMNVCVYHACFLYWHELAKTMCTDFVTCLNCLNCHWKWAWALTLYNTLAQKCYPCTSSVPCLPSLPATHQPAQLRATPSHRVLQKHATRLGIALTNFIIEVFKHSI